jgi:nucleotide-binding universal stress UspA family protein
MIDLVNHAPAPVGQANSNGLTDVWIGAPIIVATNGEPGANGAICVARLLNARDGTPVHAITVLEPQAPNLLTQERLPKETDGARIAVLRKRVKRQFGTLDVPKDGWDVQISSGRPGDAIAALSIQTHAGLVLVGMGNHGALGQVWGRDTALHTVHHARSPVMAVNPDVRSLPQSVVVGTDFGPASLVAARAAVRMAAPDGVVHLVHVQPLFTLLAEGNSAFDVAYGQELRSRFDPLIDALTPPSGVRVVHEITRGDPARRLIEIAERERADLIAVGNHAYGVLSRLALRSVASRVMRAAMCSVLIAPEVRQHTTMTGGPGLERTVVSTAPSEWVTLLTDFTRRNAERPTALEIDDPAIGAQSLELGYHLRGAAYDHRDERAELMLGGRKAGPHITHTMPAIDEVGIATGPDGRDSALRIGSGRSAMILTFLD